MKKSGTRMGKDREPMSGKGDRKKKQYKEPLTQNLNININKGKIRLSNNNGGSQYWDIEKGKKWKFDVRDRSPALGSGEIKNLD